MKIIAATSTTSGAKITPNPTPESAGAYILKFKVRGAAGTEIQGQIFQNATAGGAGLTTGDSSLFRQLILGKIRTIFTGVVPATESILE